jgi:hypothetical protein
MPYGNSTLAQNYDLTIRGLKIENPTSDCIRFRNYYNKTAYLIDSILSSWSLISWETGSGAATSAILYRQYTYNANVVNSSGTNLQNIRVAIFDLAGASQTNQLTDASGNITPVTLSHGYYAYATGTTEQMKTPHTYKIRSYDYAWQELTKGISAPINDQFALTANPYIVASSSTAATYSSLFSFDLTNKIITVNGNATPQKLYDYHQYYMSQSGQMQYAPLMTAVSSKLFNMGNTRIVVASGGTFTCDETSGMLQFGTGYANATNAVLVQSGGTLVVGTSTSASRILDFLKIGDGTNTYMASETSAAINVAVGGTFTWNSGEIQTHGALAFYGTVTISAVGCFLNNVGGLTSASFYPQIRQHSANTTITGITLSGFVIVLIASPAQMSNVVSKYTDEGFSLSSLSPSDTFIPISGSDLTNNVVVPFAFWQNKWVRVVNYVNGSNYNAAGHEIASSIYNLGLHEVRQAVSFTVPTGAKAYTKDTNNGIRLAANQVGNNASYTSDIAYTLSESSGLASYSTNGGILTGVWYRTQAGTRDQYNRFDSRGKANDTTDKFDFLFTVYGKQVATYEYILKGTSTYTSTPAFLPDLGITQATKAIVAAYTGIACNYSGGTLTATVTSNHSWDEVYDYIKYWESENPANVWANSKASFVTTSNKLNYVFSNLAITVTGCTLTCGAGQVLPTKPTVASSGIFIDADGVIKNVSSSTYYFSPVTFTFKDGATGKQYVEAAVYDSSATNRTYNSSFSAVTSLTSDSSGVVTGYALYKVDSTTYTGHTLKGRLYGYATYSVPKTINGATVNTTEQLTADNNVQADRATASAITGIALDYGAKTIATSGTKTLRNRYDWIKWSDSLAANLAQPDTISTADGVTYILASTWSDIVSGTLLELDKATTYTSGTLTVSSGGLYEDKNGAVKDISGTTYKASRYVGNVKDAVTSTDIEGVGIFVLDATTNTHLLYDTSWTEAPIETDADGDVTAYIVYQIGVTTYSNIKQVFGEYSYNYAVVPRSIAGLPIGLAASPEVTRLTSYIENTKTKVQALAVTGVTSNCATKHLDEGDNTLADVHDYVKAMQSSVDMFGAMHGLESYLRCGSLIIKSGTNYTNLSDWTYLNVGAGGTVNNGTVEMDDGENPAFTVGTTTLEFTVAGSYNWSAITFTGTVTLTNSSGGSVSCWRELRCYWAKCHCHRAVDLPERFGGRWCCGN